MNDCGNIIDFVARRAERQKAAALLPRSPATVVQEAPRPRLTGELLRQKQQKVIEELRALGYEMSLPGKTQRR